MSRLLARIMFALLMLPMAAVAYLISLPIALETMRDESAFLVCGVILTICVFVYWTLLWRASVRWTKQRITATALGSIGALVAGVIVAVVLGQIVGDEFGMFVWAPTMNVLWLIWTVFVWRETPAERGECLSGSSRTVACPQCGYNMTGLRQTICPECGCSSTIDELMAGQPGSDSDLVV